MPRAKTLPDRLFVVRETDPNDKDAEWYCATEGTIDIEDGETVGVYKLVETQRKAVLHKLLPK